VELKLAELRKSEELLRLRLAELEQLEERNTSVEEEGVREQAEGRVATEELFETDQQNVTDEDRNVTDEDRKMENRKQEDRKEEQVAEKDADGDSETALKNQVG
jgi:hypothetical protein